MHSLRAIAVAIGITSAALAPALAADNTPLNVKPGLWEITSDSEHSGTPPIPPEALAKLSPEQRAKFEAAMKQSMGPQHRVGKHCVTQADIDKGFERMDQMGGAQCTHKLVQSSATRREGTFACTSQHGENSTGSYRVEARSPESVVGSWDVTMSGGSNTMKMKTDMQAKWLGANCGDTKH